MVIPAAQLDEKVADIVRHDGVRLPTGALCFELVFSLFLFLCFRLFWHRVPVQVYNTYLASSNTEQQVLVPEDISFLVSLFFRSDYSTISGPKLLELLLLRIFAQQ
jgi:hypothetical protein